MMTTNQKTEHPARKGYMYSNHQIQGLLVSLGIPKDEVYQRTGIPVRQQRRFVRVEARPWWEKQSLLNRAKAAYMVRLKTVHPDNGGNHVDAAKLLLCWRKIKRWAKRQGLNLMFLLLPTLGFSATNKLTLAWDANPEPDVARYVLYQGTNSQRYITNYVSEGRTNTTNQIIRLTGTNYFVVTAVNALGLESEPSNELVLIQPLPPTRLRIVPIIQSAQYPSGPWSNATSLATVEFPITEIKFFRLKADAEAVP